MVNALTAEDYLGIGPVKSGDSGSGVPVGSIILFAGIIAPEEFLFCDGSEINRSEFSNLFAAIGTTYGIGDGSTTFNLPDTRGRSPLGEGMGSGLTARTLGDEFGEEDHQLTIAELAAHTHTAAQNSLVHPLFSSSGAQAVAEDVVLSGSTGGDVAHNTMHPSLVFNFIIKT